MKPGAAPMGHLVQFPEPHKAQKQSKAGRSVGSLAGIVAMSKN